MKKLTIFILGLFIPCMMSAATKGNVLLNGSIDHPAGISYVRIVYPVVENGRYSIVDADSIKVENGKFTYRADIPGLTVARLWYHRERTPLTIFLEPGTISLRFDGRHPHLLKSSGSSVDSEVEDFYREMEQVEQADHDIMLAYQAAKDSVILLQKKKVLFSKDDEQRLLAPLLERHDSLLDIRNEYVVKFCQRHADYRITRGLLCQALEKDPHLYQQVAQMPLAAAPDTDTLLSSLLEKALRESAIICKCKENPIGALAPDFFIHTTDGKPLRLSDYRGRRVLLYFWSCQHPFAPNELEFLTVLQQLYERNTGLEIIGISQTSDDRLLKKVIKERNIRWPEVAESPYFVAHDSNNAYLTIDKYPIRAFPTFFLIDSEGVIREKWEKT